MQALQLLTRDTYMAFTAGWFRGRLFALPCEDRTTLRYSGVNGLAVVGHS